MSVRIVYEGNTPHFIDTTTGEELTLPEATPLLTAKQANRLDLVNKAVNAIEANKTFLAIASPTNAQTLAQVKLLTREMNAVIKMLVQDFTDTSGT